MRRWNIRLLIISLLMLFLLSGCLLPHENSEMVEMYNADGDRVGTARLNETDGGVSVNVEVEGLSPGFHAIHVHEYGRCEAPDFSSSGNHFNPEGKDHGLLRTDGPHIGDLPNIEADASGNVQEELIIADATLKQGKNSLIANNGTSLIIHDGVDDGMSQPAGNSGDRIVCGVLSEDAESGEEQDAPTDPTENNDKQKNEENG
ncbi:superoxide dismutase family protein [Oceanobacillus jeddahense]|uniref:Superoxide dismutase family protein n=1 Tax=Oceanobacillus jeddahense TaxID=1462527 RepID=A0ABY5JNR1_9BACI|nr:superoxide dismutase family protein [Oceanobacillus jeddahense]UUI01919.1 superoxide dismutase family protein [Oceanobacillus jeddahense]